MDKDHFHTQNAGKSRAAEFCHCRDSSIEELSRLGNNGNYLPLAQYRGDLYDLRPASQSSCCLCHYLKVVHKVPFDELEAAFKAYFEVRYRGNWYPCFMIGGITSDPQDVCVVADDPHNLSGLGSANNSYMWGSGVEIRCKQIEAVRLWLSDPVDPRILTL